MATQDTARLIDAREVVIKTTNPDQEAHDYQLTELYLRFRCKEPRRAKRWVGEQVIRGSRGGYRVFIPDALILDENGSTEVLIEFGGEYEPERLVRLHESCVLREEAYELW